MSCRPCIAPAIADSIIADDVEPWFLGDQRAQLVELVAMHAHALAELGIAGETRLAGARQHPAGGGEHDGVWLREARHVPRDHFGSINAAVVGSPQSRHFPRVNAVLTLCRTAQKLARLSEPGKLYPKLIICVSSLTVKIHAITP
jgi:hypothetical protein